MRDALLVREPASDGTPLHLAASLSCREGRNNKFHDSALVGSLLIVRYGRIGGGTGETGVRRFASDAEAASAYWTLLRGKLAKGYLVGDACVLSFRSDQVDPLTAPGVSPYYLSRSAATMLMGDWTGLVRERAREENRPARPHGRNIVERSPRTAKQGKDVLLTLCSLEPDPEVLLACAFAQESESFLRSMVATHPRCPDEALVALALTKMSTGSASR